MMMMMMASVFSPHRICCNIVVINQMIHFAIAKGSSYRGGGSYHRSSGGSSSSNYRSGGSRGFPMWIPFHSFRNHGSQCSGDECQEKGSVGWMDVLLLLLIGAGIVACCCLFASNHRQPQGGDQNYSQADQNYNRYASMQDKRGTSSATTTNQHYMAAEQQYPRQMPIVVQGQHVQMAPRQQQQIPSTNQFPSKSSHSSPPLPPVV